jgi:hypothetical protein
MYGYKVHLLKKYSTVNKELHSVSGTCVYMCIKSRNLILARPGVSITNISAKGTKEKTAANLFSTE